MFDYFFGSSLNGVILLISFLILFAISIYFIFLHFNQKIDKIEEEHKSKYEELKKREKKQTELMSNMTEDIYILTKELKKEQTPSNTTKEDKILSSAHNLLELLRIKSETTDVFNEKFNFNHLLDDIVVYLKENFKNYKTELVFDISHNVPRFLSGDVVHFSRILNNLLEFCMQRTEDGIINVKVNSRSTYSDQFLIELEVKDTSRGLLSHEIRNLFDIEYEKNTDRQKGLGLYVAKELTRAMKGDLKVNSTLGQGTTFTLILPMENKDNTRRKYRLANIKLTNKKILIISDRYRSASSVKNLFTYFKHDVKVITRDDLDRRKVNISDFNIILVDDYILDPVTCAYIKLAQKQNKNTLRLIKMVDVFSNTTNSCDDSLIETSIQMPTNMEKIFNLITDLDDDKTMPIHILKNIPEQKPSSILALPPVIHKDPIEETKDITTDSFNIFKGSRLLIVEDNLINQKIILGVLKKSGISISIANNGQEALDILFVERKEFDIILMDISMPVMDGLTATKRIRGEAKTFKHIPIITFTAFSMGTEISQMFDAGVNAYLTKPLNIKKLYTVFNMYLSQLNKKISLKETIKIQGLDTEHGINAADEDEDLYKETLKRFLLVYKETLTTIPSLINDKKYTQIKIACRDIRTILDAIGAYEMKELIDEMLLVFLYNKDAEIDRYTKEYPKRFTLLIDAIDEYLKN